MGPCEVGTGLRPSGLVSRLLLDIKTEPSGCPEAAGLDGAAGLASVVAVGSIGGASPSWLVPEFGPPLTDDVPGPGDSPRSRKRRSAAARLSIY